MSPKKYAMLCGMYMTNYPGLKSSEGSKTGFDANNIYRAQADDFGGLNVKSKKKIKDTGRKRKK